MYPAGRILHLVPARLVFSAEQLAKLGKLCISGLPRMHVGKRSIGCAWAFLGIYKARGCGEGGVWRGGGLVAKRC